MGASEWVGWLLRVVGVGVILAGVAHALLPRQLGWTTERIGSSALGDLVVRMHVGFIGLFMIILGALTIIAVPEVAAGSPLGTALAVSAAVLFGVRAWCEGTLVRRTLAGDPGLARWWTWLHRCALIIWPFLTLVYAATAWQALASHAG